MLFETQNPNKLPSSHDLVAAMTLTLAARRCGLTPLHTGPGPWLQTLLYCEEGVAIPQGADGFLVNNDDEGKVLYRPQGKL